MHKYISAVLYHRWPSDNSWMKLSLYYLSSFIFLPICQSSQGRAGMSCEDGFFRCGNGACVNETLACNGVEDCSDKSDEDHHYAGCGEPGMSHGLIAIVVIGSIAGALVLCCWVGSVVECAQRLYKSSCPCVQSNSNSNRQQTQSGLTGLAVTTVIANQNADPSTVIVARTLPPSYSSVIVNEGPLIEMSSINTNKNGSREMVNASVQVDTIKHDSSKSIRWL